MRDGDDVETLDAEEVVRLGYQMDDACTACHDEYMLSRRLRQQQKR